VNSHRTRDRSVDRSHAALYLGASGNIETVWAGGETARAGYPGWLPGALQETRNALDPAALARAVRAATHRPLDDLVDELITQPAKSCQEPRPLGHDKLSFS